ncbi:B-cell antigen receptor complex-associated protein beta chain [Echinops telfairi]|uniref:B-cell antigen receptor complex-associated protein beta chain n=1 Tax=Echinops telfairi TaxID=9371 RepID=A0AC55DUJ2_ECHTE|nr:B-cell antigen receptor complex-associated protein beta chain [Echinops telfairi]
MAGLVLSPVPSNWLVLLLLLLSAGETVPATKTEDLYPDSSGSPCSRIWQNPRFVARKRSYTVKVKCHTDGTGVVKWFWKRLGDQEPRELLEDQSHILQTWNHSVATLTIRDIQYEDNGVYFCQQTCGGPRPETHWGCGTELRVMGGSQAGPDLNQSGHGREDDSKAGMEEDHTYEGLNVDQTATYEDIVTLRTGEVKWSVGEHPGQE